MTKTFITKAINNEVQAEVSDQLLYEKLIPIRIASNFRGYENSAAFTKGIHDFAATVQFDVPLRKEGLDSTFVEVSERCVAANKEEFDKFYQQVILQTPELKNYTKQQIMEVMLRVAARAYQQDKNLWKDAVTSSHTYPFCMPKDGGVDIPL